jgi:alpha-tubulin suppressor-like RCC1 family protein
VLFGNQRIRQAAAGYFHLVVAEDGAVYICGYGVYGRLGLGNMQPQRRLTRVPQAAFEGSRVIESSNTQPPTFPSPSSAQNLHRA